MLTVRILCVRFGRGSTTALQQRLLRLRLWGTANNRFTLRKGVAQPSETVTPTRTGETPSLPRARASVPPNEDAGAAC